jgi:hypothetical protein
LASTIAAASRGRSLRFAFHLDKFCDLFAMVAYEIAPHRLALRLDANSARLSMTRGRKDRYHRW